MTPINWDKGMSDKVASGEVLSTSSGLRRFELHADKHGEDQVTKRLWELMS